MPCPSITVRRTVSGSTDSQKARSGEAPPKPSAPMPVGGKLVLKGGLQVKASKAQSADSDLPASPATAAAAAAAAKLKLPVALPFSANTLLSRYHA